MNTKLCTLALLAVIILPSCGSSGSGTAPVSEDKPSGTAPSSQDEGGVRLQTLLSDTHLSSKGVIESMHVVPIFCRITGQITALNVELGQRVRKGQVLVRLDESDIRAELLKREAELEQADEEGAC